MQLKSIAFHFGVYVPNTQMPEKIDKIRDTMYARSNPVIFRGASYVAAISVAGANYSLGGSWWKVPAAILLVATLSFVLPASVPKDRFRRGISAALDRILFWPWWVRFVCAILMVAGVVAFDYLAGELPLGRAFNLYLLPIFCCSMLFGFPLAILIWLLSIIVVYFFVIPPEYSFELGSLKDFSDLMAFFYLGLITLAIPVLIRASAAAREQR